MLALIGQPHHHCDGLSRRQFLGVGTLGLAGLSLADVLRADAENPPTAKPCRPKSIIYIVLSGGLSHIDTYDPKPDAPPEFRGEFATIPTALPGVRFCEHFPKQAAMLGKLALLRGVASVENDHFLSEVYTGLPLRAGKRPAFGSVASKLLGPANHMPAYVTLRESTEDRFEFEKPYYVGASHSPFRPFGEALQNMTPVKALDRLEDRRALLAAFDTMRRDLDHAGTPAGTDRFHAQAIDLITSPTVREAFDIRKEPAKNIERYGKGKYTHQADKKILYDWDGKPFVLARRLVEAGVRVVTLQVGSWDHHSGANQHIFESYKHVLPVMDQSICALVTDLEERGLSEDVLVVVLSEFGRTPKLSMPGPGREHWSEAGCVLLAGGGLKMGQVIGETDSRAERAKSGRTNFQNIMATLYRVLGIDPTVALPDFTGRPTPLLDETEPVPGLLA